MDAQQLATLERARPPETAVEEQLSTLEKARARARDDAELLAYMTGAESPPSLRERCVRTLLCAAPSFDAASRSEIDAALAAHFADDCASALLHLDAFAGAACLPDALDAAFAVWWARQSEIGPSLTTGFGRPCISRALRRLLDVSEAALRRCPAAVAWGDAGRSAAHLEQLAEKARDEVPIASAKARQQARFLERRLHCIKEEHEAEVRRKRHELELLCALEEEGGGDFAAGGLC